VVDVLAVALKAEVAGLDDASVNRSHRDLMDFRFSANRVSSLQDVGFW
jgi:hypothetical protein